MTNPLLNCCIRLGCITISIVLEIDKKECEKSLLNGLSCSGYAVGSAVNKALFALDAKRIQFHLCNALEELGAFAYYLCLVNQLGYVSKTECETLKKCVSEIKEQLTALIISAGH